MQRLTETPTIEHEDAARESGPRHNWISWIPLVVLPATSCVFRSRLAPWQFMWLLSITIFVGCKWRTWFVAREVRARAALARSLGYLFLWPGMDANSFLGDTPPVRKPGVIEWTSAVAKTVAGATLIVLVARNLSVLPPLLAGWLAMLGLVLLLHFGTFHLLALLWQSAGVNAEPIMRLPLASTSLGEFWGKRWNIGFRELSYGLVFQPVRKWLGLVPATLAAFFASGLIHDFVISFPARGGYGLPTAYFLVQGTGVLLERSAAGRRLGLARGVRGWLFVLLFAGTPAFFLFHPVFVRRVIIPFIAAIGSMLGFH
jgi:hypothetical protein